jgi:hypothetical protein
MSVKGNLNMMKIVSGCLIAVFTLSLPSVSSAACYCACINNKKVKVCQNSWDANYVFCDGTYCSGELDLPNESPMDSNAKERLLALVNTQDKLMSLIKN